VRVARALARPCWVAALAAAAVLAAGCTSSTSAPEPTVTHVETTVVTRPASPVPTYTPAPVTSVPVRPADGTPKGEIAKPCPYIRTGLDQDPQTSQPNLADLEGDRVGLTTVLPKYRPVGCRFYFAYGSQAIADILPTTFASPAEAYDAMVATGKRGRTAAGHPDFVPGVDGISYQTRFFGPDGDTDWAFVFAKGDLLVVVHTQQTNSPNNALYIAEAIVGKL
jgi:hypothetical protein